MIARLWRGWARPQTADTYERYFRESVLKELEGIAGFAGGQLLRRDSGEEVEVIAMTYFETLEAVRGFAGDDFERAVVSDYAQTLLTRYELTCAHYMVVELSGRAEPEA